MRFISQTGARGVLLQVSDKAVRGGVFAVPHPIRQIILQTFKTVEVRENYVPAYRENVVHGEIVDSRLPTPAVPETISVFPAIKGT